MLSLLQSGWLLLAQEGAKAAGNANAAGNGKAPAPATPGFFENPLMLTMIGLFALFYFLFMRPQNKQRKERENALKALKKNDKVTTIGGIRGVVVSVNPDEREVVIRVDETTGTKLRMSQAAIHEIMRDEDAKSGDAADKK